MFDEHEGDSEESLVDFDSVWSLKSPFDSCKATLAQALILSENFNINYPYDLMLNHVVARGMVRSACELEMPIEVRYKWECLDEDNIIMHSVFGIVVAINVNINDEAEGFMIDGTDWGYGFMALDYGRIFWVGEADKPNHNGV